METALEMWYALDNAARMHLTIKLLKDGDVSRKAFEIMKQVSYEARKEEVVE